MNFIWNRQFKPKSDGRPHNFEGTYYGKNPGVDWKPYIPIENRPINYLEIGVLHGANVLHVANSYCKHPDSKIYCLDPWIDYDDYSEYKGQQEIGWNLFNKNIQKSENFNKFIVKRGFSDKIVPTFEDKFFDIIFVDGNHETEYVYKDGCMSFEKVKSDGYIIFDDYTPGWSQTMKGIDMFVEEYKDKIKVLNGNNPFQIHQLIVQKL